MIRTPNNSCAIILITFFRGYVQISILFVDKILRTFWENSTLRKYLLLNKPILEFLKQSLKRYETLVRSLAVKISWDMFNLILIKIKFSNTNKLESFGTKERAFGDLF